MTQARTKTARKTTPAWVIPVAVLAVLALGAGGVFVFKAREAAKASAEHAAREAAAQAAAAPFADPAERAFVAAATSGLADGEAKFSQFRSITLGAAFDGSRRAVCGETASAAQPWTGFVAHRPAAGGDLVIVVEKDGFDTARRDVCRPLVMKYLGQRNVNFGEANAAFAAARCKGLDTDYWMAVKALCQPATTAPVAP